MSSQVNDPATNETGAGAGANFAGSEQAQRNFRESAGVVEGRPGIIESSNIDPLNENSNKGESIYATLRLHSHLLHLFDQMTAGQTSDLGAQGSAVLPVLR